MLGQLLNQLVRGHSDFHIAGTGERRPLHQGGDGFRQAHVDVQTGKHGRELADAQLAKLDRCQEDAAVRTRVTAQGLLDCTANVGEGLVRLRAFFLLDSVGKRSNGLAQDTQGRRQSLLVSKAGLAERLQVLWLAACPDREAHRHLPRSGRGHGRREAELAARVEATASAQAAAEAATILNIVVRQLQELADRRHGLRRRLLRKCGDPSLSALLLRLFVAQGLQVHFADQGIQPSRLVAN
mmetsp:Transcript_80495/g.260704  ORF Transcript_80495/g.260704 Transcript_80495/m.260704 type:complete len:240 (-) Transcript_80495:4936-5655(-)